MTLNRPIYKESEDRVLLLDGGLGTMVQGYGLREEDFRGEAFAAHTLELKGCNDVLTITRPDIVSEIHEAYLMAGADIISTDTFNATSISLADYGLENHVYEINKVGATLARTIADEFTARNPHKPRFVAGSIGPTNRSASMSADMNNPASRAVTFDELVQSYGVQVRGLMDGGVDLLLIETVFDTLNAKAALFAVDAECESRGIRIPVMVSGTVADIGGRMLSGQTIEAFYVSLKHADMFSIGLNCGFGARQLRPFLARMAAVAGCRVSAHPNAGLPNVMGGYDETPAMFAADVEEFLREGLLNIVGGCCGTTPLHISELASIVGKYKARVVPRPEPETELSGLEPLKINEQSNFVNIGERANVAGSAKFARLIREGNYEEALTVARQQVEAGAQIIDICMDDGMIDGPSAMTTFLNYAMSEPEISRVPVMIDSSSWEVIEAGLKCVQGKCLVNSISLKEGERELVRKARLLRRYGAAAVVMLFDEFGQADVLSRKIEVAKRAYEILTANGFPPEDIVFDPNVLAIGTGIEEHNGYGVDFIEACAWIKENLPYAKVSGGVSNLSFSFRGNNPIREAMHSVFLYHAIAAGMDMGIVNQALLQVYSDIEPQLLESTEDVVLNRRADATERLTEYADKTKGQVAGSQSQAADKWREEPLMRRISYAMTKGVDQYIAQDTLEAMQEAEAPLKVIDDYLMPAMNEVGTLFGSGKMFLPQVVKSARVMRKAVDVLTPYIEEGRQGGEGNGKILIATVKGDVHDIGKNIVSVVMSCNGYNILDLGVMVECERIVDEAQRWGADVIGLSGLITPSLVEMTKVMEELQRRGMDIPVLVGGATTSAIHTAVKIAPRYDGLVVRCADASDNVRVLPSVLNDRSAYAAKVKSEQRALRETYEQARRETLSLEEARSRRHIKKETDVVVPQRLGRIVFNDYAIKDVRAMIDWNFFFPAWEMKGHYPELLDDPDKGGEVRSLLADANAMLDEIEAKGLLRLDGVVGMFEARSEGDDIIIIADDREFRLPQLRSQQMTDKSLSLADFVLRAEEGKDYIAAFAITAGKGLKELAGSYREEGDQYKAIMSKLLADRLAEAFAEQVHLFVRENLWGFEREGELVVSDMLAGKYQGVRVAIGYPASPDHSQKKDLFDLLSVERSTDMRLTENYMIDPAESVCGFILADPGASYFSVGHIGRDQLEDYSRRRSKTTEEIEKLIAKHL